MITDALKNLVQNQDIEVIKRFDNAKNPNADLVEVIKQLVSDCKSMEVSIFIITD